jgi:hypothetical protein
MKRENEIVVILGKKGSGKTSYAMNELREKRRLVIFDFNREYNNLYIVTNPEKLIELLTLNYEGVFQVAYQPDATRSLDEHFDHLSKALFCMSNLTFLCEEVDLVSSAGEMPEGLQKIINYGRHRGISLIALSRRAHKVPRDLTANADRIISFAQFEPRDLRYLAEYMGEDAARRVLKLVRNDTGAEYLEWENGDLSSGKISFLDKTISGVYRIGTEKPSDECPGKPDNLTVEKSED